MKAISTFVCCAAIAAALTACKGKSPAAESEPQAATSVNEQAETAKAETKVLRRLTTKVEVDTSAPPNVGSVPADAKRSESGLAWVVLKEGKGDAHPTNDDVAVMNFIGWTRDGNLVDESLSRGVPAAIAVGALFPGWAEGVQLMVPGEKRRFWIPGELAFGAATPDEAPAKGPPKGMLVYDVELLRIKSRSEAAAE